VVKAEDSWLRGRGFKPFEEIIFTHRSFGSTAWSKKREMECSNLPGIVACAVIPLMGGWTLRTVGLQKTSFITNDELEACQLTRTKVAPKKEKRKRNYKLQSINLIWGHLTWSYCCSPVQKDVPANKAYDKAGSKTYPNHK
jgi:hypothetical protein